MLGMYIISVRYGDRSRNNVLGADKEGKGYCYQHIIWQISSFVVTRI